MALAIDTASTHILEQALTWPDRARALAITAHEGYTTAGEFLKDIKALRKEVDAAFDPIITKAHEAHKEAVGQKKRADTPLLEAETILKRGLIAWDTEQETIRRADEQRLQAIALKEEEARRAKEAAALELQANATGDESLRAEAEELISAPVQAPVVYVPPSTPKVAGISYREVWKYRVVNEAKIPREYLTRDDAKIGGVVRAMKGATAIPGIEAYAEKVASAGSR